MTNHSQQSKFLTDKFSLTISKGIISNAKEINQPVNNHDR
tara:strand:- start:374 stop:493 length:120 start_codon:yes stop_codon:yes gene_type:complete